MKGILHKRLVVAAAAIGLSLNSFITKAVRASLDDIEERQAKRKDKDK